MKRNTHQKPIILIVDEHVFYLETLQLCLEMHQFVVMVATDVASALQCLKKYPIDLIMSKFDILNIDDRQLFDSVRNDPTGKNMPFIFLTNQPAMRKGERGATYVSKGCSLEGILAKINNQLLIY